MFSPGRRVAAVAALLALAATAAACGTNSPRSAAGSTGSGSGATSPANLYGTDLEPALPPPAQALSDTSGRPFSIADRARTHLTVLFFGYTHCPDVCPSTVADLAGARQQLPEALREKVTVVFVTEDPERDTPAALRRWLDGFDPSFVGLAGGRTTTQAILNQLYLPETTRNLRPSEPVRHSPGVQHDQHRDYGVDHSGIVYAFAPEPPRTVIYTGGTTVADYASDFTRLAQSLR